MIEYIWKTDFALHPTNFWLASTGKDCVFFTDHSGLLVSLCPTDL
jgi:hypothetical protein